MIQQVFVSEILLNAVVLIRHNSFRDGQHSMELQTFRRASIPELKLVQCAVTASCLGLKKWLSFRISADHVEINNMTVHIIIADDLQTRIICAKLERKLLRGRRLPRPFRRRGKSSLKHYCRPLRASFRAGHTIDLLEQSISSDEAKRANVLSNNGTLWNSVWDARNWL